MTSAVAHRSVLASRPDVDLSAFRTRIRLLRAWRLGAMFGCVGAGIGIAALVGDYLNAWDVTPTLLIGFVAAGIAAGFVRAGVERFSDAQIAKSIDRRSGFDERLTTVFDLLKESDQTSFREALRVDTAGRMHSLSPTALYPIRLRREHGAFTVLAALCTLLYLLIDTQILLPPSARAQAAQLKQVASQVEQIARPALQQSQRPGATEDERQLARDLERFAHDLSKRRMSKQDALIRANQLAEQAQKLEASRSAAMAQSLDKAQTAGARLEQMSAQAKPEKSDAAKLADKANAIEKQIAAAQQQLNSAHSGHSNMSSTAQKALEKKLGEMTKALQQLRLSQQASDTLNMLSSMPEFQEAQELLSKLQRASQAQQDGDPSQASPEQMRQMADRLEQLAKKLDTDAKMKEYAKSLLEAAKNAKAGGNGSTGAQLLGAFGLGPSRGQGNSAMGGQSNGAKGTGGASEDTWVGDHGSLSKADKSSLLNVKFQDRVIASQKGTSGPETYTDTTGPAQLGPKTGIPYQDLLPAYQKSAESAIAKGNVPPEMRTQVRDYFNSLHQ